MAKSDKPNILIIWGDDIGYWNISHYSKGMMGYQTPNTQWLSPGRNSHLGPRDVFRRHSFEMLKHKGGQGAGWKQVALKCGPREWPFVLAGRGVGIQK